MTLKTTMDDALIDLAPTALLRADDEACIIHMNAQARDLLRRDDANTEDAGLFAGLSADDRAAAETIWHDARTSRTDADLVLRRKAKDGTMRYVRLILRPCPAPDTSWIGAVSDISSRMAARDTVLSAGDMLRRLERIGRMGLWWFYPARQDVQWSEGVYRIHGLDPMGPPPSLEQAVNFYHPQDQNSVAAHLEHSQRTGEPFEFRLRIIGADGQLRHVRSRGDVEMGPDGTAHCIYGVFQDISEEMETAKALRASEERYERMVDASGIALWDWDTQTNQLHVSARLFDLLGYDAEPGSRPMDFLVSHVHEADRTSFLDALKRGLTGNKVFDAQIRMQTVSGDTIWVRARADTRRDSRGQPRSMSGSMLDVTREKLSQTQLEQANDQAQAANRAKSDFLAMMSHEIRTPMNAIMGMLDLLGGTEMQSKQNSYVDLAQESARALLDIINDILDFSKLDAGRMELEEIDFDTTRTVESAVSMLRPRAEEKGLALTLSLAPDLPGVLRGDPGRIRQILVNLISNAIKFTETGGVTVTVTLQETDREMPRLRFEIQDTGIGIPEAVRPRLFSRFVQADSSIRRKFGGTGLGLAICKHLCELMNGEIDARSTDGEGSTFWFEVPFAPGARQSVAPPTPSGQISACNTPLAILVAEDNQINQTVIRAILDKLGHACEIVDNGRKAVERIRTRDYDLVLMDIQMPDMDGVMATKVIRVMDGPKAQVPIIALTANAMSGDREAYLDAGITDYVSKPIDVRDLMAAIERCRPERKPAVPSDMQAPPADAECTTRETEVLSKLLTSLG